MYRNRREAMIMTEPQEYKEAHKSQRKYEGGGVIAPNHQTVIYLSAKKVSDVISVDIK